MENETRLFLEKERVLKVVSDTLNDFDDLKSTLIFIISNIKIITGCEAVSIRLREGSDYPYFVNDGFPESFINHENYICSKGEKSELQCMCGNIIRGDFDSKVDFFTSKGSFWCNNTSKLPRNELEGKWLQNARYYCLECGYESLILISIKSGGDIIGLIQVNDKRVGMFSTDIVEYLEVLGQEIGLAIDNSIMRMEIKKNEELMRINADIDRLHTDFLVNIPHEFRTPLNVILGSVQLLDINLKELLHNEENYKTLKRINVIKQNCNRLLRLVNNLLDITKMESGLYEINEENQDIVEIIEKITLSIKDYVEDLGMTIHFKKYLKSKIIAVDGEKIERILLNLFSNSIKYSKSKGGNINVEIYEEELNKSIIISVKDNGIGIIEDRIDSIFDRFKQIEDLYTREHEGSGIGLSIVKSLVEMHGGSIKVESKLGNGSEFIINLPIRLVAEKDNIIDKYRVTDFNVEKLKIEFSDIYSINI